jgi:hypothetical protein
MQCALLGIEQAASRSRAASIMLSNSMCQCSGELHYATAWTASEGHIAFLFALALRINQWLSSTCKLTDL